MPFPVLAGRIYQAVSRDADLMTPAGSRKQQLFF